MDGIRVVALDGLREQIRSAIGEHEDLFQQFSKAIASKDADELEAAFKALETYPDALLDALHGAIMAWLFAGPDGAGLDHMDLPSNAMH